MVDGPRHSILYIEDDEDMVDLCKIVLEGERHTVVSASTGSEGISLFEEYRPEIVVTDFQLPDMDGLEVADKILRRSPDTPIVLVTGRGNERVAAQALSLGISQYVIKTGVETYSSILPGILEKVGEQLETKRRLNESETRFRDFANSVADRFWETDADGRYTYISEARENLNFLQDDLHGRTIWEVAGIYHNEQRGQDLRLLMEKRQTFRDFEVSFSNSETQIVHLILTGIPRHNTNGEFLGFRGTMVDVTDTHLQEEQLRQAQKMEAVGQLTGGIAHDFNNLLMTIVGNLELIQDIATLSGQTRNRIEKAIDAVRRGGDLTQRLLAFARKQNLEPEVIDPGDQINQMLGLIDRTLGDNIVIDTRYEDGLWPVNVDPSQLESAFLNIAINARDAMPSGGRLKIQCQNVVLGQEAQDRYKGIDPGEYVKLIVEDSGTGIEAQVLEKAFEPFFSTKGVGKGSGLGLSMVYGFVKQSGGYIYLESTVGLGTSVIIFLPKSSQPLQSLSAYSDWQTICNGAGKRVLVIDDDPDVREVVVATLDQLGFRVIDGGDGREALHLIDENSETLDLLLSDVVLPYGMSGAELAHVVKARCKNAKVLLMSGHIDDNLSGYPSGLRDIDLIKKPFRAGEIAHRVSETLDL